MKSKIYSGLALALFAVSARAQTAFTPGNIVVMRVGDGVTPLSANGSPAFLDEYNVSGTTATLVNTIALPASGAGNKIILSGTATSEGIITRSANGQYIAVAGYNTAAPYSGNVGNAASTALNRAVALVKYDGTVNVTNSFSDVSTANNVRVAYTIDGSGVYVAGGAGGLRYAAAGATTSTQLNSSVANVRYITTAEDGTNGAQLYLTSASGTTRIATVGTGLPNTAGQTVTNLPGTLATGSPYQIFFADLSASVPGVDVLYVADDGSSGTSAGITKYSLVSGSWVSNGTIGAATDLYRGITGIINPAGGSVSIFAVGLGGAGATGGGKLVTFTDNTGYNGALGTPTVTTLITAATDKAFRGVSLAPFNTAGANTFVGNLSSNFNLPLNYSTGAAPSATADATIPASGAMTSPVLSGANNQVQNLNINTGASLTLNTGVTLKVAGAINNSGTLTANGNVVLNGTAAQTIASGNFTGNTLANLEVNNAAGVTLSTPLTVSGTLTLTNGLLSTTGTNTITLSSNAPAAVSGGTSSSYINGTLARTLNTTAGAAYFFPIGAGGRFRPVRITNPAGGTTAASSFSATYFPAAYSNTTSTDPAYHVSTLEYWEISRLSGSDAENVSLITDDNTASKIGNTGTVEVGHYNGSTWDHLGNNSGNTTFGANGSEVTATGVSVFSPFTFISNDVLNPLPVHIAHFDLSRGNSTVGLSWLLTATDGMSNIVLERSADGNNYSAIAQFAGGSRTEVQESFEDKAPFAGMNIYRLRVSDLSGKVYYSEARQAFFSTDGGTDAGLYPNPTKGVVSLYWSVVKPAAISVYNVYGRRIMSSQSSGGNTAQVDLGAFADGYYFIVLQQQGKAAQRFTVIKN